MANSVETRYPRVRAKLRTGPVMATVQEALLSMKAWTVTLEDLTDGTLVPIDFQFALPQKPPSGGSQYRRTILLGLKTPLAVGHKYRLSVLVTLSDGSEYSNPVTTAPIEAYVTREGKELPSYGVLAITSHSSNDNITTEKDNFVAFGTKGDYPVTTVTMTPTAPSGPAVPAAQVFDTRTGWYATFDPLTAGTTYTLNATDSNGGTATPVTGLVIN